MDLIAGHFVAAESAPISVFLGFVPDFLKLTNLTTHTNYFWAKALADNALTGQYGWIETGESDCIIASISATSSGARMAANAGADSGISAMKDTGQYVMIDHPDGTGEVPCPVIEWTAASVFTVTPLSRIATSPGVIMRPNPRNGFIYECISAAAGSSTSATQPTWSKVVGGQSDDDDIGWICRTEKTAGKGGQGFIVGSGITTNSDVWHFEAYRCDIDEYLGDAANGELHM